MSTPTLPLSQFITVGHLETPLKGAVTLTSEMPGRSAIKLLEAQKFDQAPVLNDDGPSGYVLLADLKTRRGSVKVSEKRILPRNLVSADTGLGAALLWLADTGFLFVLREREVTGFVVPADLNKQAGRAYFYLALTEFELALSASIRHAFPAQTVLLDTAVLTRRQIEKVVSRQRRHAAENQDSDLVAEFDLVELCAAAGADERLRCVLESASARTWSEIFPALQPLRNAVAHSNRELLAGVTVAQMAEAVRLVERMTVALR